MTASQTPSFSDLLRESFSSADPVIREDARRTALRLLLDRSQRDPVLRASLEENPRAAIAQYGLDLPADRRVIISRPGDLVLQLPPQKQLSPSGTQRNEANTLVAFYIGSGHHYVNNPFSGGHKSEDVWWIDLPNGAQFERVDVTSNAPSNQGGARLVRATPDPAGQTQRYAIAIHWWYNMWFDVHYEFKLWASGVAITNAYGFSQDDDTTGKSGSTILLPAPGEQILIEGK